jgi:hypothetical protein
MVKLMREVGAMPLILVMLGIGVAVYKHGLKHCITSRCKYIRCGCVECERDVINESDALEFTRGMSRSSDEGRPIPLTLGGVP